VRFLGIDLAWGEGRPGRPANETGVVVLDSTGRVLEAGWTRGLQDTVEWVLTAAGDGPAVAFVDAPLIVDNSHGQRLCETRVGQCYGRWKVSANTTNTHSPRLAGVAFRKRLEAAGWRYSEGLAEPADDARTVCECYPYTTLVGTPELGYDMERPRYKRKPKSMPVARWRPARAAACDELVRRLGRLTDADPPLYLGSHATTRRLLDEPSPIGDVSYKHREDLIDAVLCAWTAMLWYRYGPLRCQVLGSPSGSGRSPAIIAPARPEQRLKGPARWTVPGAGGSGPTCRPSLRPDGSRE
jgi:predicted RNase H-like nuclease